MRWFHPKSASARALRSLADTSGRIQEENIFSYIQEHQGLSVSGFTRLIQACSNSGTLQAGRLLDFEIRSRELQGNKSLGNHLINMYGRLASVDDAKRSFQSIEKKNSVSYNAIITVLAENGMCREALILFRSLLLEDSKLANSVTFVATLKSCSFNLETGRWLHALVDSTGLVTDLVVGTALVNMYASCGSFTHAKMVFDGMEERNEITWTALIGAHAAVTGNSKQAWQTFIEMEQSGVIPNEVTFITLLSACTQPQDLDIGCLVHEASEELGYAHQAIVSNALVNMYGKCGGLEEAKRVFDESSHKCSDPVPWNSLIA